MNITPELIITIVTSIGGALGGMSQMLKGAFRTFMSQMDKRFDALEVQYKGLSKELHDFKYHAIQNYASQEQIQGIERNNSAAHSNIHTRIDAISEKLVKIETIQQQCKSCKGM